MSGYSAPLATASVGGPPAVSFALLGADGTVDAARAEHRAMYAASTIKLHVMCAVLEGIDSGEFASDQVLAATRMFTGTDGEPFTLEGNHLDHSFPADGTSVTVAQLLHAMIARSSNEATNMLMQLVGFEAIARQCQRLGLEETRIKRMIGDAAAIDQGLTNETSALDLARTMHALVRGHLASEASTSLAVQALSAQTIPVIATALRDTVTWGSKSGEVPGIRHDVAFVGAPHSPDGFRTLAVTTSGFNDEAAANEAIAALTAALLPDVTG